VTTRLILSDDRYLGRSMQPKRQLPPPADEGIPKATRRGQRRGQMYDHSREAASGIDEDYQAPSYARRC